MANFGDSTAIAYKSPKFPVLSTQCTGHFAVQIRTHSDLSVCRGAQSLAADIANWPVRCRPSSEREAVCLVSAIERASQ